MCEPQPGLVGPPGFHTTAREPKRAHLSAPVFKNTTKIQREDLPEREERKKISGGRGQKKSEILGGPGGGRSRGRAVQGKGGPGEGRSREGRKGGPGEGRKGGPGRAVQGKKGGPREGSRGRAVKPNLETNTHTQTQHNTTHNKLNSWPKSVLAKVGFGQSRFRQSRPRPASAKLVVLVGEVPGRWSSEIVTHLRLLAEAKSRSEPSLLHHRVESAWRVRWSSLLFAGPRGGDGVTPTLADVLQEHRLCGLVRTTVCSSFFSKRKNCGRSH